MAAATVCDFRNFKILTTISVKGFKLRQVPKFRGSCRHLGFLKFRNFNCRKGQEGQTATACQISCDRSTRCWNMAIFRFFEIAAIRHIGFVMLVFGPHTRAFSGLYHCAKFGWNRHSSFNNTQVLIFCDYDWKPIENACSRPKMAVFRDLSLNRGQSHRDPQKALPCAATRHMTYRSSKSVHVPARASRRIK